MTHTEPGACTHSEARNTHAFVQSVHVANACTHTGEYAPCDDGEHVDTALQCLPSVCGGGVGRRQAAVHIGLHRFPPKVVIACSHTQGQAQWFSSQHYGQQAASLPVCVCVCARTCVVRVCACMPLARAPQTTLPRANNSGTGPQGLCKQPASKLF